MGELAPHPTSPPRFGLLGTARIAANALVDPARRMGVPVVAVASRDVDRARDFADSQGIKSVSKSYEALLARDDLDAVYVPLPAALRYEWSMRALERGLHVLAEKPIALDAGQAREMARLAESRGLVLAEGFHYLFHPMFTRALELLRGDAIGEIEQLDAMFDMAVSRGPESTIYLDPSLGGGVLLHQACYPLHAVRSLVGTEPEVLSAQATLGATGVDEKIDVRLSFANGVTGRVRASMAQEASLLMCVEVRGSRGTMRLDNFVGPHVGAYNPAMGGRITVWRDGGTTVDEPFVGDTTYAYQLAAFCAATAGGPALPVQGDGAVANMTLIDAVRAAAGM